MWIHGSTDISSRTAACRPYGISSMPASLISSWKTGIISARIMIARSWPGMNSSSPPGRRCRAIIPNVFTACLYTTYRPAPARSAPAISSYGRFCSALGASKAVCASRGKRCAVMAAGAHDGAFRPRRRPPGSGALARRQNPLHGVDNRLRLRVDFDIDAIAESFLTERGAQQRFRN